MLSPGRHAIKDIPNMVSEIASEYPDIPFDVTEPLGLDDHIIEVIKGVTFNVFKRYKKRIYTIRI